MFYRSMFFFRIFFPLIQQMFITAITAQISHSQRTPTQLNNFKIIFQ